MKVNLNKQCRVRLTSEGKEQYTQFHVSLGVPLDRCIPRVDNRGYSYFVLWEIMQIYGDRMYNGNTVAMFHNNELEFV